MVFNEQLTVQGKLLLQKYKHAPNHFPRGGVGTQIFASAYKNSLSFLFNLLLSLEQDEALGSHSVTIPLSMQGSSCSSPGSSPCSFHSVLFILKQREGNLCSCEPSSAGCSFCRGCSISITPPQDFTQALKDQLLIHQTLTPASTFSKKTGKHLQNSPGTEQALDGSALFLDELRISIHHFCHYFCLQTA